MTPAREAESQARRALSLRHFRDGLFLVAAYFAACALVSDAHPANRKEFPMEIHTDVVWHSHTAEPATRVKAIIILGTGTGQSKVVLSELYEWDADQGYWVSASSRLRLRHPIFSWRDVAPLLPGAAAPTWQRDEEATAELLSVVGIDIDGESVAFWQDHQVRDAEDWAAAVHLRASDGAVHVPPMPMFLRDCQRSAS